MKNATCIVWEPVKGFFRYEHKGYRFKHVAVITQDIYVYTDYPEGLNAILKIPEAMEFLLSYTGSTMIPNSLTNEIEAIGNFAMKHGLTLKAVKTLRKRIFLANTYLTNLFPNAIKIIVRFDSRRIHGILGIVQFDDKILRFDCYCNRSNQIVCREITN